MMPPKEKSTKTLQRAGEEGVSLGVGGGTLILLYIRRLGPFLGVQILNFNILGGFQKDEILGDGGWRGMMKLWIFKGGGGGLFKTGLFLGGISKHSRDIFLRSRYRIGMSSSPPPLIQGRLSHDLSCFICFCYESPLSLNILSCEVKKRNEYVILGGGGGGVESCSIERLTLLF